jgi:hypothetical protein
MCNVQVIKRFARSAVPVAALRAFDFKSIAEPNTPTTAAPMTRHVAIGHAEMTRHGTDTKIFEAANTARRGRARLRKANDVASLFCIFVTLVVSHNRPKSFYEGGAFRFEHRSAEHAFSSQMKHPHPIFANYLCKKEIF